MGPDARLSLFVDPPCATAGDLPGAAALHLQPQAATSGEGFAELAKLWSAVLLRKHPILTCAHQRKCCQGCLAGWGSLGKHCAHASALCHVSLQFTAFAKQYALEHGPIILEMDTYR